MKTLTVVNDTSSTQTVFFCAETHLTAASKLGAAACSSPTSHSLAAGAKTELTMAADGTGATVSVQAKKGTACLLLPTGQAVGNFDQITIDVSKLSKDTGQHNTC